MSTFDGYFRISKRKIVLVAIMMENRYVIFMFKHLRILSLFIFTWPCCGVSSAQNQSKNDVVAKEKNVAYSDSLLPIDRPSKNLKNEKKNYRINWHNLPYAFDDLALMVGITNSNLYYSYYYRELSFTPGFSIGVEDFFPVFDKAFLHTGLKYTQLGLEHSAYDITFTTHNIDVPLFLSYELPELRKFDLRLLIGTRFLFRTGSTTKGIYPATDDFYRFNPPRFNHFDFGFTFGLSAEYKNFFTSLRGYIGFIKLMPDDSGMNTSYSMEVGYFIFRNLRNKN